VARAWHPTTKEYLARGDENLLAADGYVIIEAPGQSTLATPDCEPRYWKLVNGQIVEMSQQDKDAADEASEPITVRHAREQAAGVTLTNGWVMKWSNADQLEMIKAKTHADLLAMGGVTTESVPFFEADGTPHMLSYSAAYVVLADYSTRVAAEQLRQWSELSGG